MCHLSYNAYTLSSLSNKCQKHPLHKMFRVIIQLLFVPIKEFDATNRQAEKMTRRRDETGERLKVYVCCLSQLPSGISHSSHRASGVYQVCCGWLMMWVFGSQYQFIPKVASLLPCEICSWQDGTSSGRTFRPRDKDDVFLHLVQILKSVLGLISSDSLGLFLSSSINPNCASILRYIHDPIYHLHHMCECANSANKGNSTPFSVII